MQGDTSALAVRAAETDYEAIVIGAGVSGIYLIYRLQELGVSATVLEASDDLGGTWHHNRYPGCRFDSESVTYAYSFSKELLDDWTWSEHFAGRAETERYLRHVAERFDLRKHMQFNCRVETATYDEEQRAWSLKVSDGRTLTTRFLITAMGLLSAPTPPRYKGVDRFEGLSFHTYFAPEEPVDYTGKRVAIVGTGATGVQIISELADKVGELRVFQRRANWCAPLHNSPITPDQMAQYRANYSDIFAQCAATPGGFLHAADPRASKDVSEEERHAFWEELYASPGFGIWLGNFKDVLLDEEANAEFSAFMADKIRARVHDPVVAEKLIPKDHGFGTRRVPMETRYYEAYNRKNVHLVDISETPIEEITPKGIRTTEREFEFDIIIYSTGFDAITGSFDRMDFVGLDGQHLRDKWVNGPLTTYGVMSVGFPNLIIVAGPQAGSGATNFPRGIEEGINWVIDLLQFMDMKGYTSIEPKQPAEDEWQRHVREQADKMLLSKGQSWFNGYNSNLDRSSDNRHVMYVGGLPRYRRKLQSETENEYQSFKFA